jgi:hypothetical protein
VRCLILRPAVRLDLDDAGLAPPRLVVADEARPEQARCDDRGRSDEPPAIDDAQAEALWK